MFSGLFVCLNVYMHVSNLNLHLLCLCRQWPNLSLWWIRFRRMLVTSTSDWTWLKTATCSSSQYQRPQTRYQAVRWEQQQDNYLTQWAHTGVQWEVFSEPKRVYWFGKISANTCIWLCVLEEKEDTMTKLFLNQLELPQLKIQKKTNFYASTSCIYFKGCVSNIFLI